MKKMSKRLGAFLLTAAMAASLSAGAFAADAGVAKIGTQSYDSLQKAFEAVQNGETIQLQKNVTDGVAYSYSGSGTRAVTLDLNGYSISKSGADAVSLTSVKADTLRVVIENGSISATGSDASAIESDGARLTLQNMQVKAADAQAVVLTDAKVNVNSANVTGAEDAICAANSIIYLNAGVFTCTSDANNNGAIFAARSTVYTASEEDVNLDFVVAAGVPAVVTPSDWRDVASTKITVTNFADVPVASWYCGFVYNMVKQDVVSGYSAWEFQPQTKVTRAQLASMLAKESGEDLSIYAGTTNFTDVSANAWYAPAVEWAYERGVIVGYGDGKFGPEDSVTREQTCMMLYSYQTKYREIEPFCCVLAPNFTDKDEISGWAKTAVETMANENILHGYPDANGFSFRPKGATTRAEMCALLSNMIVEFKAIQK